MVEERFNPTRMELLKSRARAKLAKKGHSLLKQKRDALVLEFFRILKKASDLRGQLNAHMKKAYSSIAIAQSYHGVFEVEAASMSSERAPKVKINVRNVMGVKIPSVEVSGNGNGESEKNLLASNAKIDEAADNFKEALQMVVKLAETENSIRKLIREIEKTKRRVNSLEYIVIPSLAAKAKLISFRLDEMERDAFFMLKMTKKKLARKGS
ncbi:V-type ATP synthase subunit D [Candidatus Micrarchaeota archaeon CG11_big_fil_rev_8_21_14_0_20_47_5]|nr:MAG: hypothetical protein AUJ17_00255 [Candidatus Micrarchaeota archaeon CG1_02_47_40]PIN82556.1 MAG: V-type ATP synthase subunit D [Candidatus Micrarchaeota archaeon CG11_big_fil_rev_8_21_14_0_20_47_5]